MKLSIVFGCTLLYAILRYNIFGTIPLTDIPTLIVNKAIAFSMIIILLRAFISRIKNRYESFYSLVRVFKIFAIIHVLISVSLFSCQYYPKLFIDEKLSLYGNLAVLLGVLTFVYTVNKRYRIQNLVVFALAALHLFFIGAKTWLDVSKWYGMMPPITLICFLILITLILLSVLKKKYYFFESNSV